MIKLTEEKLEALCIAIRGGATLAEACRETGLNYDSIKTRVSRGKSAGSPARDREVRARVIQAAADFGSTARGIIQDAAREGKARALDEVLRRIERLSIELNPPEEPPKDRREFIEWRLRQVRTWIAEDSGIARTKLMASERDLMTELASMDSEGPLTHEEACTLLEQDAPDWSDRQLLIIHAEGLRRGIPGFVERE